MEPKTVGRVAGGQYRSENAHVLCHGFPVGLPVTTAEGEVPVEYLTPGQQILTRNGGTVELAEVIATTQTTRAIRISAGSFGTSQPAEDIVLPADQPVLVCDWRAMALFGQSQAVTSAGQLVDGDEIVDIGPRRLVLFRLVFDRPRIVHAGGLQLGASPGASLPHRAVA